MGSSSSDGSDDTGGKVNLANAMVGCVRDVEGILVDSQPFRRVQRSRCCSSKVS